MKGTHFCRKIGTLLATLAIIIHSFVLAAAAALTAALLLYALSLALAVEAGAAEFTPEKASQSRQEQPGAASAACSGGQRLLPPPPLLVAAAAAALPEAQDDSVRCRLSGICEGNSPPCPPGNSGADGAEDADDAWLACLTTDEQRAAAVQAAVRHAWRGYT